MSDFMNRSEYCCQASCEAPGTESVIGELRKQRDDARLEADRLRAEVARLAKERDEAIAEARLAAIWP